MKKPRILILMHFMDLGGAEMALVGLLNALDAEKVDVDLFINSHHGPMMKFIPSHVHLLPQKRKNAMIWRPMKEAAKNFQYDIILARIIAKFQHKQWHEKIKKTNKSDISAFQYVMKYCTPFLPKINPEEKYDLVISFLDPHNIGLKNVNAKKRLAWIHTDYSTVLVNPKQELPIWSGYDYIASISPKVTESFLSVFPSLAPKIIEIENILSSAFVGSRAEEEIDSEEFKNYNGIKLLSVGRFTYAKNYDNVPAIAKLIKELGLTDFKWFIIGFGGDEALIRKKIEEIGMQDNVNILGKKENPYPYIKNCDIYIQPSRYEGKSVTVREAQMLCKPVVITNYPTAASQVRDGLDGIIVPLDNASCASAIVDLIGDRAKRESLSSYCAQNDFGNLAEVEKIYTLLGI